MQPKIYSRHEHSIDQQLIDPDALYVMNRLRQAGYIAYLVGGSVRDLWMGHTPKDFDISTSAKPEEIKKLFSNSLLIGRRFRLAHIRFGKKYLEVSTFRSGENTNSDLIVRDNIWGSPEEDVLRRDFTINGLFYDPAEEVIIDYVGGGEDLSKHLLRTIGKSEQRFRQDPVRMIRLLKFRARFNFAIEPEAWHAMNLCKEEILKSSPARVLEELLRMLESGSATAFFKLLAECGLLHLLFPNLNQFMQSTQNSEAYAYLEAADRLIQHDKAATPSRAVLTCCLLFPPLQEAIKAYCQQNEEHPNFGIIIDQTHILMRHLMTSAFSALPKRLRAIVDFVLHTQYRLTPLGGKRPHRLRVSRHPDFGLAMQFLQLRAFAHPELKESVAFWKSATKYKPKHKPSSHPDEQPQQLS